ncbi:MAG: hypothetical protein IT236_18365 [Bacteroidia bacterium]|nr:hypothetical protein [Bacteroidia bacterium]
MKIKILTLITIMALAIIACKKQNTTPAQPNYTNFKILNVKLSAMPFLDKSSDEWDPFDGPDVFFNMEDASSNVLYNGSSSRYKDISKTDLPLIWDFVTAYPITNLDVTHFVTAYDYDTIDPNDLIGYIGFKLSEHKSGYPKTITKTLNGLTVTINGEWY